MKRYYIIFEGRVQGVGFRYTAQRLASDYHLTGWVRNCYDGNVDCEVQGTEENIHRFIRSINNPENSWIRIDNYAQKSIPIVKDEKRFGVRF